MKKSTKPRNLKDIIIISLVIFNFIVSIFCKLFGSSILHSKRGPIALFSARP